MTNLTITAAYLITSLLCFIVSAVCARRWLIRFLGKDEWNNTDWLDKASVFAVLWFISFVPLINFCVAFWIMVYGNDAVQKAAKEAEKKAEKKRRKKEMKKNYKKMKKYILRGGFIRDANGKLCKEGDKVSVTLKIDPQGKETETHTAYLKWLNTYFGFDFRDEKFDGAWCGAVENVEFTLVEACEQCENCKA